jgi:hypothetical protein
MKFDELYDSIINEYFNNRGGHVATGDGFEAPGSDDSKNDWKYERSSRPAQKEGDVFTGKDGRRWVRFKKADGTLGVRPHKG